MVDKTRISYKVSTFMPSPRYSRHTPVRIALSVISREQGLSILGHLLEERLIAGGTVVQADALHWLGGNIQKEERLVVSAYTTTGKLPLIRGRLEMLYGESAPLVSQFVMADEKKSVMGWIERNVRE